jgi:type I site-specific restriction endonuclease
MEVPIHSKKKVVNMKPEEKARKSIDHLLGAAGWEVQDIRELNLGASLGVAIREFPLESGPVDYLFLVDRNNLGRQARREFEHWLSLQEKSGRMFTPEQTEWLKMIKDHVATSLRIEMDDFELAPFYEKGGAIKAYQIFGQERDKVLEELNEALVI